MTALSGLLTGLLPEILPLLVVGCGDEPARPATGFVPVLVVDRSVGPVANQSIRISPLGVKAETDKEGIAVFAIAAGEYFVDADVCCVGPGFIRYHVPVTVVERDSTQVTLNACLACE